MSVIALVVLLVALVWLAVVLRGAQLEARNAEAATKRVLDEANTRRKTAERLVVELTAFPDSVDIASMDFVNEVRGRGCYEQHLEHPALPPAPSSGIASGIMIGIGYDLGWTDAKSIERDWSSVLAPATVARLVSVAGLTGSAASARLPDVRDIEIPYDAALNIFCEGELIKLYQILLKSTLNIQSCANRLPDSYAIPRP